MEAPALLSTGVEVVFGLSWVMNQVKSPAMSRLPSRSATQAPGEPAGSHWCPAYRFAKSNTARNSASAWPCAHAAPDNAIDGTPLSSPSAMRHQVQETSA